MRIVKRDAQGFYLDGDGIWRDQDGVSEKFRGEDVDWFGAIEEALGDACSPERNGRMCCCKHCVQQIENLAKSSWAKK